MEIGSGIQWLHNEAYGSGGPGDKDPDPVLYILSVGFPLYFTDSFFFNPTLALSANSWKYVEEFGWAMPIDPMWQSLYVLSLDLSLPIGYQLNLKSFSLAFFAGPDLNIRIPLWGEGESVRNEMISYYLSGGRFFNLSGGLAFIIPLSERFSFSLKAETAVPIHNLWDGSGLPFSDGLSVSVSAGARFIFP